MSGVAKTLFVIVMMKLERHITAETGYVLAIAVHSGVDVLTNVADAVGFVMIMTDGVCKYSLTK